MEAVSALLVSPRSLPPPAGLLRPLPRPSGCPTLRLPGPPPLQLPPGPGSPEWLCTLTPSPLSLGHFPPAPLLRGQTQSIGEPLATHCMLPTILGTAETLPASPEPPVSSPLLALRTHLSIRNHSLWASVSDLVPSAPPGCLLEHSSSAFQMLPLVLST